MRCFCSTVAMNHRGPPALYAGGAPDPGTGRPASHLRPGTWRRRYCVSRPWARDNSTSFLLGEADTRTALEHAGFRLALWIDDTEPVLDWFKAIMAIQAPSGPNLGV